MNFVFVGVAVIPMDRERTLPDHTVIVRDGRIATLGPSSSTPVLERPQVIDGCGPGTCLGSIAEFETQAKRSDSRAAKAREANDALRIKDFCGMACPERFELS